MDKEKREDSTSHFPTVAFFADSGNFENLPAYFQVDFKVLVYMNFFFSVVHCDERAANNKFSFR